MIATSNAWKAYTALHNIFHIKATLTDTNSNSLSLTDEDFMFGSVKLMDATSDADTFCVGAVITNTFQCTLNNVSGKFDGFDLGGATIVVQFGIVFEDSTEEWITRGTYIIDRPSSLGSTIEILAYDAMDKMNKYYIGEDGNGDDIVFPISASSFAETLCDYCGVDWDANSWPLGSFNIDEFEYDESTTCRQVLGWVLQIAGGFARIDASGTVRCKWYIQTSGIIFDGGVFSPWETADVMDGGTMWVATADYDGGEFYDTDHWEFNQVSQATVGVDDIAITGVRAYAYNTVDEFQFETVGSSGYILALQDNPLITADNMLAVATRVNAQMSGIQFRIYNATIWGTPSMEAGDICVIKDYKDRLYASYITNMTFTLNGLMEVSCGAETPGENSLEVANPQTQTIAGAVVASYDYIRAKKISADYISAGELGVNGTITASNLEITGGEVGNFIIQNGMIRSHYEIDHVFTQAEAAEASGIASGAIVPTPEQVALYDIDGDGTVTKLDHLVIASAVANNGGIIETTITLDPKTAGKMISVETPSGYNTYIGANGVVAEHLGITMGDEAIADFAVVGARYTSPDLTYHVKRYHNGEQIVEGCIKLGTIAITHSYTNGWYYDTGNVAQLLYDYPFVTVDSLMTTASGDTGLLSCNPYSYDNYTFACYIGNTVSGNVTNAKIHFRTVGTWK